MANLIRLEHGHYIEAHKITGVRACGVDKDSGKWRVVVTVTNPEFTITLRVYRTIHEIDALAARVNRAQE